MTGWHRHLCPRKQSSKANKTMVLYSSNAPHTSFSPAGIHPTQLAPRAIPQNQTLKKKQSFSLCPWPHAHTALSCAHAGDVDLSYSQNMVSCTCTFRGQTSYAVLDWTCGYWAFLTYLLCEANLWKWPNHG